MTTKEAPTVNVRQAKEMARQIIAHHFGTKPKRIVHQPGGMTNIVFLAFHQEGNFIVRISPDPAKLQGFIKEQWAVAKAREVGVRTVEILEVGNQVIPLPYMVSRMASGQEATFHPQRQQI